MSYPTAYEPEPGCMYQLFCRNKKYRDSKNWEHLDYAESRAEKKEMLINYRMSYAGDPGWEIKVIMLPRKYWPKRDKVTEES